MSAEGVRLLMQLNLSGKGDREGITARLCADYLCLPIFMRFCGAVPVIGGCFIYFVIIF